MADELAVLDRGITAALVALRRARAALEHSPNSTAVMRADMAESTLDGLLDQRWLAVLGARGTAPSELSAPHH
jgi:hypothetical protein